MEHNTFKKIAYFTLTAGALVASQSVLAHTRLQTPVTTEGTRVYNAATIGHGCEAEVAGQPNSSVIANSIVFPDGLDSTVTVNDAVVDGAVVTDYVENWGGQIAYIPSRDVFDKGALVRDPSGNVVGVHSWKGNLPGDDAVGLVPFRVSALVINEASCAKSVKFNVAIADICKLTKPSGFNAHTVNFWTPVVDGSNFNGDPLDAHGRYNSPASYTVTRTSALPEECGAGEVVVVNPSALQLNRDMPIPGVWPKKGN
jgi:hypothetical protein